MLDIPLVQYGVTRTDNKAAPRKHTLILANAKIQPVCFALDDGTRYFPGTTCRRGYKHQNGDDGENLQKYLLTTVSGWSWPAAANPIRTRYTNKVGAEAGTTSKIIEIVCFFGHI